MNNRQMSAISGIIVVITLVILICIINVVNNSHSSEVIITKEQITNIHTQTQQLNAKMTASTKITGFITHEYESTSATYGKLHSYSIITGLSIVVVDNEILKMNYVDKTWKSIAHFDKYIKKIQFVTTEVGYIMTRDGKLYHTDNGGKTWNITPQKLILQHISFVDLNNGWSISDYQLFRTMDGGRNWKRISIPCQVLVEMNSGIGQFDFYDKYNGWFVCQYIPATIMQQKELWKTNDSGETWTLTANTGPKSISKDNSNCFLPISGQMPVINVLNDKYAWMETGRMGLYITHDGGCSWKLAKGFHVDGPGGNDPQIFAIGHGYLQFVTGRIIETNDDGASWHTYFPK